MVCCQGTTFLLAKAGVPMLKNSLTIGFFFSPASSLQSFCWDNFLSQPTLELIHDMRSQFYDLLRDIGFVDRESEFLNRNSGWFPTSPSSFDFQLLWWYQC